VAPRAVTHEERVDLAVRLVAMQQALRTVCEGAEAAAILAKEAGASGLAVATFLMKEAIEEYGRALNRFVLGEIDDD
jgi:hypothetical protein